MLGRSYRAHCQISLGCGQARREWQLTFHMVEGMAQVVCWGLQHPVLLLVVVQNLFLDIRWLRLQSPLDQGGSRRHPRSPVVSAAAAGHPAPPTAAHAWNCPLAFSCARGAHQSGDLRCR